MHDQFRVRKSAATSIDRVAATGRTIGYEILTNLGKRYARKYVGCEPESVSVLNPKAKA
jgi:hypothetical protein